MKKTILTIFSFILGLSFTFGGGIVTNTNQSAAWVRSMVRDASVDVDAVFFNPAGLTHLEDGFYIQVNSQTVMQGRTVESTFPTLNNGLYEGSTFVPVLPTGFLAYKKGNFAVSAGFTVIGGGGSAEFDNGLPSFEQQISTLPTALAGLTAISPSLAVSGYSADIQFKGTSAYYGFQAGFSYKINDVISVGIGGRYIMANNAYTGHINDISLVTAAGTMRADDFLNNIAVPGITQASSDLTSLTGLPSLLGPYLPLIGGFTYDQVVQLIEAGQLPQEFSAYAESLQKAYAFMGMDTGTNTLQQLNDGVVQATPALQGQIATLNGTAAALSGQAGLLGDQAVDVTQSGTGFTPIISLDFSFMEGDLGLALKYEHKTTMKVTTKVNTDDTGLYKDAEEVTSDMPAMISAGLRFNATDKFRLQTGFHYYMDMGASYGKKDDSGNFVTNGEEALIGGQTTTYLAGNSYEAALGLEYDVAKMLTLSGGFLYAVTNPNSVYQSGLSYTLNTTTFGVGAAIHVMDNFDIDLGYSNTSYTAFTRDFGTFTETYDKTAMVFAAGLTFHF